MQAAAPTTDADVTFDVRAFEDDTAALGLTTIRARADWLGCGHGYYWRIAAGRKAVGTAFIRRVLSAPWPDGAPPFERYFRVS